MKQNNLDKTLNESYKNLFKIQEKEQYVDEVWKLLNQSYSYVGGTGFRDKDDLLEDTWFWKLVVKGNDVIAGVIYKDKNGRKRIASFTDQTSEGKKELYKILFDDVRFGRAYAEVSGKMEHIMIKLGAIPVPNKFVSDILNKDIEKDSDGFHYTRYIGSSKHEKIMFTGDMSVFKNVNVDIIGE